ncbi:MAG: tRNA (5-methylaminomethyl-2-thiouridine)(34)-methyltransferase MnmD, partial [Pseudomonadota bacterium]
MGGRKGPRLSWRDGVVPVSARFDDPYYSLDDGLAEARHVFLGGNSLPERFHDGFRVAELGFGTGLNLLATAEAWKESGCPGRLAFMSFELFPLPLTDARKAISQFPALLPLVEELAPLWSEGALDLSWLSARLIQGDARETLKVWRSEADAWFLDGFSPAKNPELWGEALIGEVARHTAPGGTFATYTAAGDVRRALSAAGFAVERVPGFGR